MDAYFWITLVIGLAAALLCIGATVRKSGPNDLTILSMAAVEVPLLIYSVGAIIAYSTGHPSLGDPWEFWGYMVTAFVVPVGAVYWALVDRSRWSNLVLAAAALTIIVMVLRMNQIWYAPTA